MEEKKKGGRINKKQADALNSLFFIHKKTRGNCFVLSFCVHALKVIPGPEVLKSQVYTSTLV